MKVSKTFWFELDSVWTMLWLDLVRFNFQFFWVVRSEMVWVWLSQTELNCCRLFEANIKIVVDVQLISTMCGSMVVVCMIKWLFTCVQSSNLGWCPLEITQSTVTNKHVDWESNDSFNTIMLPLYLLHRKREKVV